MNPVAIYNALTERCTKFLRVDELCRLAAQKDPKLPSESALAEEAARPLNAKQGLERAQGAFLAEVLADPAAGTHLCHAMLLPLPESREHAAQFERSGRLDLGGASVERLGKAAVVTMQNPRFLNAEDETTLRPLETAIDVALLDTKSEVCVLRGGKVEHPRYAGQRLFGAGINLTHLYQGKIRYLWYLLRDLGLVNKIYRGLAVPNASPSSRAGKRCGLARSRGSPSAGIARSCSRSTTCSLQKAPT